MAVAIFWYLLFPEKPQRNWTTDVQDLDPKSTKAAPFCQVMPCDRLLIFKMLKRWYGRENDPQGGKLYLERFNKLVQVSWPHLMPSAFDG